ncbi:hypothetical protein GQ53DRAFT_399523 [Thozetella sp. PMI_491]|nr:hypothetical protein GQ53DRAFT_399523 [Thozetella sp. PMI_491]
MQHAICDPAQRNRAATEGDQRRLHTGVQAGTRRIRFGPMNRKMALARRCRVCYAGGGLLALSFHVYVQLVRKY